MPDEGGRTPDLARESMGEEEHDLERSFPTPPTANLASPTRLARAGSTNVARLSTVTAGVALVIAALVDGLGGDVIKDVKPMELVTAAIAVFTAAGAMPGKKREAEDDD